MDYDDFHKISSWQREFSLLDLKDLSEATVDGQEWGKCTLVCPI